MSVTDNPVLSAIDAGVAIETSDITVYFARDGERIDFVNNVGDWSLYERDQVMAALATYAAVANLTFSVTEDPQDATFRLTRSPSEHGSLGFMNGPDPDYGDTQGIAWFNSLPYWGDEASGLLDPGSYTFTIFLHEFGHGLGLAHPFDEGGGSTIMPDIGEGLGLDQGIYTVMTYNDGWPEAPEGPPDSRAHGWNLGPSAIDIAVIQAKYGANMDTATGNTRYVLPAADRPGTGYLAIWDAGGNDAIVYRGSADTLIDLRAATLLPEAGGGGFVSHASGVHGGFTIANGVVIERAVGGSGDDTLIGNEARNVLKGGTGADRLIGGRGDDVYDIADTADTIVEARGEGTDTIRSAAVDIDLSDHAFVEAGVLTGKAALSLWGTSGWNSLSGNGAANALFGRAGDDTLDGRGGADRMVGGAGDDVYAFDGTDFLEEKAGGGTDRIESGDGDIDLADFAHFEDVTLLGRAKLGAIGTAGANTLTGNRAGNLIEGGGGADHLDGGKGPDTLLGGAGEDTLIGGRGRNDLEGGSGDDLFVFAPGDSRNVVRDFAGGDRLDLTAFGVPEESFEACLVQCGGSARVELDNLRIVLQDVALASLADDFAII